MKQKIKKLAYTIPLESKYIEGGNIVVARLEMPTHKGKKKNIISISLNLENNPKELSHPEWKVLIPKRKVKELRKALKKVCN
ncbi:hypothetical protein B6S12_08260 [Helicobacter valdiviensis]|uniref:Uncharacterized protein n=1 Tax=Helicobacter valdiviensis TaxID=1458358 RepID=A0A2W6MT63_9HELI|nr:hypothetical protein [Helicobacter valdiviensis]PZT47612.1 hypothetical protein B6S12_08260 [Helicobacter valdiviensis]